MNDLHVVYLIICLILFNEKISPKTEQNNETEFQ